MIRFLRSVIVLQGTVIVGFCFWFFVELENNQYLQAYLGPYRDLAGGYVGATMAISAAVAMTQLKRVLEKPPVTLPTNGASLVGVFPGPRTSDPVPSQSQSLNVKNPAGTGNTIAKAKPSDLSVFVGERNAQYNFVPESPRGRFLPSREKKEVTA